MLPFNYHVSYKIWLIFNQGNYVRDNNINMHISWRNCHKNCIYLCLYYFAHYCLIVYLIRFDMYANKRMNFIENNVLFMFDYIILIIWYVFVSIYRRKLVFFKIT